MKKTMFLLIVFVPWISFAQQATEKLDCTSSDCHYDLMSKSNIHAPLEDDCFSCHEGDRKSHPQAKGKEFELTDEMPVLCYQCHDPLNVQSHVHGPVADGECSTCHSPHSSDNSALLINLESGSVCSNCHDPFKEADQHFHGPAISRQCQACHQSHQSESPKLLHMSPPDLCFQCHELEAGEGDLKFVHAAFSEGCLQCHSPHASEFRKLILGGVPVLCYTCHDDIASQVKTLPSVHGAINEKNSCMDCHEPHASMHEGMLNEWEKTLCYRCHGAESVVSNKHIKNIEKRMKEMKYVHAPALEECSHCHFSHASEHNYLLTASFPRTNYAIGTTTAFGLCFDCHDADVLNKEKTTTATNFRDGEINMHYLHISKNKKRNCNTCHDMHGSNHPHIIADKVSFGKWQMPINYEPDEKGGSCLPGCHQKLAYSRD